MSSAKFTRQKRMGEWCGCRYIGSDILHLNYKPAAKSQSELERTVIMLVFTPMQTQTVKYLHAPLQIF